MDKSKEKEEQSIMDKSMRSVFGEFISIKMTTITPYFILLLNVILQ